MANFEDKQKYVRWIPQAKPSQLYPFAYKFILINSIDELKKVLRNPFMDIAFDTETTGLNLDKDFLVGYSFCFDGNTAYYVPVDHAPKFIEESRIEITKKDYMLYIEQNQNNENNKFISEDKKYYHLKGHTEKFGLGHEAVRLFYERIKLCSYVYMFNARFDIRVFEKYGFVQNNIPYEERNRRLFYEFNMANIKFIDVQVLAFLSDTNVPYPSLKKSEEYFLGWRGASFEDTLGGAENFYHLTPEESYVYAATDALGTYQLAKVLWQFYLEANDNSNAISGIGISGKLDNFFLYPLMLMEDELVYIDVKLLKKYSDFYTESIQNVEDDATRIYGKAFNMGSPKQKSEALKFLGIQTFEHDGTIALNKRNEIIADKAHLQMAIDSPKTNETQKRFMKDLLDYATLSKQKGTYTDNFIKMSSNSLYKITDESKENYGDGRLRFGYKTMVVPSGRLAAGGDKKNSYFADANIQNITKPKTCDVYYIHVDSLKELGLDNSLYNNIHQEYEWNGEHTYRILDWVFKETPWPIKYNEENPNHFVIEGFKQKLNIRSSFYPGEDFLWVSCDYSAQELRLPALISREPLWTKIFAEGGDLHKEMAIQMWGKENYTKQKRKMAKKINFGILYGMTAKNFAEEFNISLAEAEDTVKRYKESAPTLFEWVAKNENQFITNGTGYTLFGRPRRLGFYLKSDKRGLYNFGIRSCTNTVIQGSGADCLKQGFINLYKKFFKPEYLQENRKYIRFINTVHDEINFAVNKNYARAIIPKIIECMRLWQDDWAFPMQVGLDIGTRWGQTVAFNYDGRPYVKIDEQPLSPGDKRFRYISYDEVDFLEGCSKNLIGKTRYIEDPNGDYVINKNYLKVGIPAGDPYNPADFNKESVKEEVTIEEPIDSFTDDLISQFKEE